MKLLIITPVIPYPLDEGGKVSQFAFLEYLQDFITIHLAVVPSSLHDLQNISLLEKKLPKVKIHSINHIQKPVYLKKEKRKIPFYKKIYWTITDFIFKSKNKAKKSIVVAKNTIDDFDRNLAFFNTYNRLVINNLYDLANVIQPDIIQIEHNAFLNFIEIFNKHKTIFVEHEIQFSRLLSFKNKNLSAFEKYKIEYNRTIEIALLNKYSSILTFSHDDKELLYQNNVNIPIEVSPFPISEFAFRKPNDDEKKINKVVFVGGSNHFPNRDAIEWYIENIAESVYHDTLLKFHIIGKCSDDLVEKYSLKSFVIFEGYVDDLQKACINSIMVVPLRMGSGIRTKILYGMAQELPIISTDIGCEGLGTTNSINIINANTAEEFKNKIKEIYNNPDISNTLAENGYNFVKNNFSQKKLSERRLEIYHQLLS